MWSILIILVGSTWAVSSPSNLLISSECPDGWTFNHAIGYCYYVSQRLYSQSDAMTYCTSIGGSLTTIKNIPERDAATGASNGQLLSPWVAAQRNSSTNPFLWPDGTTANFFWSANEPSINGNCATIRSIDPVGMKATPCYSNQPALCRQQPALCNGGNFGDGTMTTGTIQSPGYPVQYYNNLDCTYVITGPPNTYITIVFDPYLVEPYRDRINVYDGNGTDHFIRSMTTSTDKNSFESTMNQMTIVFITDESDTDKGWLGTWTALRFQPNITGTGTFGEMTSFQYPNLYLPNTEQMYYITVGTGFQINATIDNFATEIYRDRLEIYDSAMIGVNSVANLSGSSVAPFNLLSSSNVLSMRFITDGSIQMSGWHLSWIIA